MNTKYENTKIKADATDSCPENDRFSKPQRCASMATRFRGIRNVVAVSAALLLISSVGCQWLRSITGRSDSAKNAPNKPTSRPATTQLSSEVVSPVPVGLETTNRPIVQGPLPLIYLVESDGMLRVRNIDTNEEIIAFEVKAMQILRVESKGVMLANKPVIGANLAPGNYAIEIVNPDSNAVRSTQTRGVIQVQ